MGQDGEEQEDTARMWTKSAQTRVHTGNMQRDGTEKWIGQDMNVYYDIPAMVEPQLIR